jgi:hypothetical protein
MIEGAQIMAAGFGYSDLSLARRTEGWSFSKFRRFAGNKV